MTPCKLLTLIAALALLAESAASASGAGAPAIVTTRSTSLGTILVTASGRTLYMDAGDGRGHFACNGGCLTSWPPLATAGTPKAAGKAQASLLGAVRHGSLTQVTYAGHPLYTFARDSASDPTSGEGVTDFYVLRPNGATITRASTTTSSSSSSSAGYYGGNDPGW